MNTKTENRKNRIIDIDGPIGRPDNLSQEAHKVLSYDNFKKELRKVLETRPDKITLNIRSNGGDIHEALLIFEELEQLKQQGIQITTCCYGYAASAATLVAQAASPGCRLIAPSAMYLIHNSTTALEGNALDARHTLQLLSQTDQKMAEICGSTTDCNRFASDDTIGTGSLRSQKDGSVYRVTGMISFGSIVMGDMDGETVGDGEGGTVKLGPGEIGVGDYITQIRERNANVENSEGIISAIEEELNNIAGTINRTIDLIESDPEIQYCINGRDLSQITGNDGEMTSGRFPNLLNQVKMQIATAALRQAQDNYNNKLNTAIAEATREASVDLAQYMCQMLPTTGGVVLGGLDVDTPLTEPYSISYDVGAGLDNSVLVQGAGRSSNAISDTAVMDKTAGSGKFAEVVNSFTGLGSNRVKVELHSGTREMWSLFNRDTRTCHYCTYTITKSCESVSKKGFLGIGAKDELKCTESEPVEKCEDIVM